MLDYFGYLDDRDQIATEDKVNSAIFIGASTGSSVAADNMRLKVANETLDMDNVSCYINTIVQVERDDVFAAFPRTEEFLRDSLSIPEQLQHKFIISIDGNTCAWSRVPWIMNSNSVLLKKKSSTVNWYYSRMAAGKEYIEFNDASELPGCIAYLAANPEAVADIVIAAQTFVQTYLTPESHMTYLRELMYELSAHG